VADLYHVKEQMLENVEKHYDSTRSVPRFFGKFSRVFPGLEIVWGCTREDFN